MFRSESWSQTLISSMQDKAVQTDFFYPCTKTAYEMLCCYYTNATFNSDNEENERDHRMEVTVKEGPADCTRMDEVAAGLKR